MAGLRPLARICTKSLRGTVGKLRPKMRAIHKSTTAFGVRCPMGGTWLNKSSRMLVSLSRLIPAYSNQLAKFQRINIVVLLVQLA